MLSSSSSGGKGRSGDPILQVSLTAAHSALVLFQVGLSLWLVLYLNSQEQLVSNVLGALRSFKEDVLAVSGKGVLAQACQPSLPSGPVSSRVDVQNCTAQATQLPSHLYGLQPPLLPSGFRTFETLLDESTATKKIHKFGHMYGEYLDPMRLTQRKVNLLEIGLQYGASLNLWLSAFPHGHVYGLEYNQLDLRAARDLQGRATVFRGDQTNVTLLQEITSHVRGEVGELDFIVDDGGHSMEQQIVSFTHLLPLVRPGGVYFIEDVQTSYYTRCHHHWNKEKYCYGGGPPGKKNTTMDLLKSFLDVLNSDFMEDHKDQDKLGSGVYSVNPVDRLIGSVQCWRNLCAIRRKFNDFF